MGDLVVPDVTYAEIAHMWETRDPMPPGLVEKVLVTIASDDLDAEYELLHLVERTHDLAGTRRDVTEALTIIFSGEAISLMMRVSPLENDERRLDGWISPARTATVTLKQKDASYTAVADAKGRFEIAELPAGLSRVTLADVPDLSDEDAEFQACATLFATPTFEL